MKAVDYTSKGDDDLIDIVVNDVKTKIQKKFIDDPKLTEKELFEIGVYNSENDISANPKTGENKPDELTGFTSALTDSLNSIISSLSELKASVEKNSKLSCDSFNICIDELQSYVNTLDSESEISSQSNTN
jgi:hypothetical protein